MYDKPYIRLVNAHTESIGADHHADCAVLPLLLPLGAGLSSKSGMVE